MRKLPSGKVLWGYAKKSEIDPEIRPVVTRLNQRGLYTIDSCAGHLGPGIREGVRGPNYIADARNRGHIAFDRRYLTGRGKAIRTTLTQAGLRNIKRRGNVFSFDRVG